MSHEKSQANFERAQKVLPGGVNSPVRSFKHIGTSPIYFERADGPYLYDVDGKRYIDFCAGFGPVILGHNPRSVVESITRQVSRGTTFGACHPVEVELAEKLLVGYPHLHKARLLNSGTEAVMTAIRLARGYTGRAKVLKFDGCYHGHSDGLLAQAGSGVAQFGQGNTEAASQGVPPSLVQDTVIARYDSLASIESAFKEFPGQIAALIVEPIPANFGLWVPKYEHIRAVVEIAKTNGALVIFDEVITGFRLGLGGASAYYDLRPDIVTLGKVIGGGLPLAAVLSTREIMDRLAPLGDVYQAGTFSGNILSATAGLAAVSELIEKRPEWNRFDNRAESFAGELKTLLGRWGEVSVTALGSVFWIYFDETPKSFPPDLTTRSRETYRTFFTRAAEAGLYFSPSPYEVSFVSFAHTDDVLAESLKIIQSLPV